MEPILKVITVLILVRYRYRFKKRTVGLLTGQRYPLHISRILIRPDFGLVLQAIAYLAWNIFHLIVSIFLVIFSAPGLFLNDNQVSHNLK
ncbi:hypothetical protein Gasu2_46920 [Galdieria sulphuraria]|uniref:Uncharacterized protein n=1 Tax=Galdieria sulphuraria TaxID=130081 RepID=M2XNE0_GALSU|nr:uncharacterized protein Gasu_10860 [Galdieria sulphuraria]EME31707.1 hypothetical protein Gasu_10860 [Galdieria sulphuraria]GJD10505.1 hypothetical protein Gasu2_46920 [Galdieria sulphuraria]|eukprot:XP_005708227.1 hypothetical protein Gasu_10860 [Galdieria sulphuraria]